MSKRTCAAPSSSSRAAPALETRRNRQATAMSWNRRIDRLCGPFENRGVVERVLLRVVGGAITGFAPIMILGLGGGNAAAAMIFGISSLAIVVFELRASAARPNDASPQHALVPVPCPAHDDNASPAMIEAVTQFAPRLRGLTRLVHGRFAQIDDVGFWQADVIHRLCDGPHRRRGRLGPRPSASSRSLLACALHRRRACRCGDRAVLQRRRPLDKQPARRGRVDWKPGWCAASG